MKWWQASLAVILFFLVFAAAAVGWHRYIATGLPLAAFMRSIYLYTNASGHLMFCDYFDALFPMAILGAGVGWIGRRQGKFFAVFHGLWVALGATAILPLYIHWLHPSPPSLDWPMYPWGWKFLIKTLLPGANLVIIPVVTLAAQHAFSPDYQEKTRTTTSDEDRIRGAMVDRFGDRFANYQPKENRPDAVAPPEPYTIRQIWAIIRLMRVRGWSVDRAAKRFRISADELRGCMRGPPPQCTAEELSAIAKVAQERGWTAEEAAKQLEVPEEPLRQHMRELGQDPMKP